MQENPHVLVIDDDERLRALLRRYLSDNGFMVTTAADAAEARSTLETLVFDLLVVDVMMPGEDGLALTRALRADGNVVPVLMLTARGESEDRIAGLEHGADDYLTKPFHPEELLLRIQALLRRAHGLANQPMLQAGGLELDESRQCCRKDGQDIELTAGEFRLLRYFMLHPGQLLSKTQLTEHLYDGETERDSNVIEVHINRLRGKLGRELIETRRGQGYRFGGQP